MDIRNVALSQGSRRLIESLVDGKRVSSKPCTSGNKRELTLRRHRFRLRLSWLGVRGGTIVVGVVAEDRSNPRYPDCFR